MESAQPFTILVVDDDATIRGFLSESLAGLGYRSNQAASGEQALSVIAAGRVPDAILLDVKMPGMGGLGFLTRLRADPRFSHIPVAILTGEEDVFASPTREIVSRMHVRTYCKPVTTDDLGPLLEVLVRSRLQESL